MAGAKGTFVIVGGGLAGAKAAETLRTEGVEGRVVLVGAEASRPYERPPLSKGYLRGDQSFDEAAAVHPDGFYADNDIEWLPATTVTELDLGQRRVIFESGERIAFDGLVLATGARPRRLRIDGAELEGVHYLREVGDSDALRSAIHAAVRVVVIGAGWIGAEVAASARQLGAEVAMIEVASVPLERVLGPEVGAVYRGLHADHGVELHLGTGVTSLEGHTSVTGVRLSDGQVVEGDVVVVGVGVMPAVELAESAGLHVDNGVVTDEYLATSAPFVFAAGDVANAFHPRYDTRIRLEHWSAALNQGPAAARNVAGHKTVYDRTPYFFSDQYDLGMEYRGWAPTWDQVVFRGDPESREFISFWLEGGRVLAVMNANIWDATEALDSLASAKPAVDPALLADPNVDLDSLASRP
jgi:3-phenylpropionate/trans-cinnamate dioxygenase ferredoxin reductase subunit